MYKVLIVDDEPMICKGIEVMIDWMSYGFCTIYHAYNGEKAQQLLKDDSIDLLVTDIKMPRMTGVELLRWMRKAGMNTHVLVLSGYDDFEYVRDMAVLGIENYLLKPVNEDEMLCNIANISEKIKHERESKQQFTMDANLIKENIMNRWFYGGIAQKELQDRAEFLNLDLETQRFQPFMLKALGREACDNRILKNEIYEICGAILTMQEGCSYCRNSDGDLLVLWSFYNGTGTDIILNSCMEKVEEKLGIHLYAIMGKIVENYWDVGESFQEALLNGVYTGQENMNQVGNDMERHMAPFTLRMAKYTLEHYQEELSLKTLAASFKGNAAYMGMSFKRDTGKSYSEYLKEIRIKKAKELLVTKGYTAKEIAGKVGFQNDTYFAATFKKYTGLTPAEYRKEFSK